MSPNLGDVLVGLSLSALTSTAVPGVVSSAPRALGAVAALKKSDGRAFGAANSSGTPSQLISRCPAGCVPGVPPLSGGPRSLRYSSPLARISSAVAPAALTTVGPD